jgi:hypothetical protein
VAVRWQIDKAARGSTSSNSLVTMMLSKADSSWQE